MKKSTQLAVSGFVLLLPCGFLIASGILGFNASPVLINPVPVMGGLLGALALNLFGILRLQAEREQTGHLVAIIVRIGAKPLNLAIVGICALLLATVLGYAFVENFRPR